MSPRSGQQCGMRIVSLLPSATEILFALGLGDQVVGVTHECDYPEAASSLQDIYWTIVQLGKLTGRETEAHVVIANLEARVREVAARVEDHTKPRVLVLEWTDPPMSAGHWTPGLVEHAGGEPVLANPGANSQVLTWEQIAASDPDTIVVAPCGFDFEKTRAAVDELRGRTEWENLRAVREGNVH